MCEHVCWSVWEHVCERVCVSCILRSQFHHQEIHWAGSGEFSLCPCECLCSRSVALGVSACDKICYRVCGVRVVSVTCPCPLVLN